MTHDMLPKYLYKAYTYIDYLGKCPASTSIRETYMPGTKTMATQGGKQDTIYIHNIVYFDYYSDIGGYRMIMRYLINVANCALNRYHNVKSEKGRGKGVKKTR